MRRALSLLLLLALLALSGLVAKAARGGDALRK